jgi:DNA repair exonuclease SbcCD ATPase subunit
LDLDKDRLELQGHSEKNFLYSQLDDLLSDSGIKKSMIDRIIPALNTRIAEISERLEFKFQFSFDSDFNPLITYLGMEVSQESLSSGQRKKMNLIVLLAFIEIIKMKHSQMNVLFLDEIFSSLDKNNVYKAIEILKEYAEKYRLTIFVVSHESLPEEFFNYRILVQTQDHFSEMKITKVG